MEIPPVENPLGAYWTQPDRSEIILDSESAVMTQASADKLKTYSHTVPTGVYAGKMWKARQPDGSFLLCWYAAAQTPNHCETHCRRIIIV